MSYKDGTFKRIIEEAGVTRPQAEDIKVFFADDMTEIKAIDSEGNEIPFASGAGPDLNGIFTASNSGGTVPTGFIANLTNDFNFRNVNTVGIRTDDNGSSTPLSINRLNNEKILNVSTTAGVGALMRIFGLANKESILLNAEGPSKINNNKGLVINNSVLDVTTPFDVYGIDTGATNYSAKFRDSTGQVVFGIRNDGQLMMDNTREFAKYNNAGGRFDIGQSILQNRLLGSKTFIETRTQTPEVTSPLTFNTNINVNAVSRILYSCQGNNLSPQLHHIFDTAGATVADATLFQVNANGTQHVKVYGDGRINFSNLPTSSAGLVAGDLWNDAGTLKIV